MKEVLLDLARKSIESHFSGRRLDTSGLKKEYPWLNEKGACFVTLSLNGELRGCVGSIEAHRSLLDDVLGNAYAAAFKDSRFTELKKTELESIVLEVSLLSEPKVVAYTDFDDLKSKIRIGIDGVILSLGGHQATFLPQVWEMLQSHELFFSHLCQKAGMQGSCLRQNPQIMTYQVKKVKEN